MTSSRDIRRCALQALYQFDLGGAEAPERVRESLAESPGDEQAHARGFQLACRAWSSRQEADAAVAALTEEWPTHRQPALDRAILRLAYHEMASAAAPPKVVINEAVELAREFSTDKSPLFINGILDKIYKSMEHGVRAGGGDAPGEPAA